MKRSLGTRLVSLWLSWVVPATSVWSAAPPATAPRLSSGRIGAPLPGRPAVPETPSPSVAAPMPAMLAAAEAAAATEPLALEAAQAEPPSPPSNCAVSLFGPQRFTRTSGPKNVYSLTFPVPTWVVSPYTLKVQNGEANGSFRVSSATIKLNGTEVAQTSDFNQSVASLERPVTLTPTTSLEVTLASKPTSYLTISFCGANGDHQPPLLAWAEPPTGSLINDATPRLVVRYADAVGAGEPAASGVDTGSLQVLLDDVDRTALFAKRSDEASADLPASLALAEGTHRLHAEMKDAAGNRGSADAAFLVDLTKPAIALAEPAAGAYLPTATPRLRISYEDLGSNVDLATLVVLINGQDRTALFTKNASEAIADLLSENALPSGTNQILARIKDRAGNENEAAVAFNVDLEPPVLTIAQPVAGARLGSSDVELIVQYSDDQKLNLSSFEAHLDGAPITLSQGAEGAMGRVTLGDGAHVFSVKIADAAGNSRDATAPFSVDTVVPAVRVVQPPPGFKLSSATPHVLVEYSDAQGLDYASLRVFVNGQDRTTLFVKGAETAQAQLTGAAALSDGTSTIVAEIRDQTGNLGEGRSEFIVDTAFPTGSFRAPLLPTSSTAPLIRFEYSDAGTGIAAGTVSVELDGADVTSRFAIDATSASGTPAAPLADGEHHVRLRVSDQAGNETVISGSVLVDTLAPTLVFSSPQPDSFVNDATPLVRFEYADAGRCVGGTGSCADGSCTGTCTPPSGVLVSSVRLFLRSGGPDAPETDITAALSASAGTAEGELPGPLGQGTQRLRAVVTDTAGNEQQAFAAFEVDTIPPAFTVETPAPGGFVANKTPSFLIRYQDERSRVDTAQFQLSVDGQDRTARLMFREVSGCAAGFFCGEAAGTLLAEEALAEGGHSVSVTVRDLAGNVSSGDPTRFTVDTLPPQARVASPPHGSYVGTPTPLIQISFTDPSEPGLPDTASGVDPLSVRILVDGTDRTSDFAITATGAAAALPAPFLDGAHTVRVDIVDYAANPDDDVSTFYVDTTPPVVTPQTPADESYTATIDADGKLTISGTLTDLDPNLSVECRLGGTAVAGQLGSGGAFTCRVDVSEGRNEVDVVVKDSTGHETISEHDVFYDATRPTLEIRAPQPGDYTSAVSLTVAGEARDASPVQSVMVTGADGVPVAATLVPITGGVTFEAHGVPLGDAATATLLTLATDAAGNTQDASVTVKIDRAQPVVEITSPLDSAYLSGASVDVAGTVDDASPVVVDVNGIPAVVTGPDDGRRTFVATIPLLDGPLPIVATAHDAAMNVGTDTVAVAVDSIAPAISLTQPLGTLFTNATSVRIAGSVSDASPVTLRLNDEPVACAPAPGGCAFDLTVPLPTAEGAPALLLRATDAASNAATRPVDVVVDRTSPTLDFASPSEGAAVGALPVLVQGTASDAHLTSVTVDGVAASVTGSAWQTSVSSLPEGPHTFTAVATDAAGNQTTRTRPVVIDLGPPILTLDSPAPGHLTRESEVTVTGSVLDRSDVIVRLQGTSLQTGVPHAATPIPVAFTLGPVPLSEGDNALVIEATDATGRSITSPLPITRDGILPTLELVTPESVSRGRPGKATATASDNFALERVVISVAGVETTFTAPPFEVNLTIPESAQPGDTLAVVAQAFDRAGNSSAPVSRTVRIASDGAITGQVLSDATGLPLEGATVRMVVGATGADTATTDERGRYSLPTASQHAILLAEKDGMTAAERETPVASGQGTFPVDARLVPLANEQTSDGSAALVAGAWSLTLPAATYRLTPLSPQGLPGLLPLGWSPLAALDVRPGAGGAGAVSGPATVAGLPDATLHLVRYDFALHAWRMTAPSLTPTGGALSLTLLEPGAYALVAADAVEPPLAVPAVGEPLAGVAAVELPATATSSGSVEPAVIPPTGGVAVGTLSVQSPSALPSGTVLSAEVSEEYKLASGDTASAETRTQDIVLFRWTPEPASGTAVPVSRPCAADSSLCASFPIAPSRTYPTSELLSGRVHLDVLSGRESVRGTVGGSEAVTLDAGAARLSVARNALAEDAAFALEEHDVSAFAAGLTGLEPLGEVVVDFSGKTLGIAAEISLHSTSVSANDTLVVARVERLDGVPRLVVVARAELVGDRIVTRAYPGLPGVLKEGRYVFYRVAGQIGFVAGTTASSAGPVKALVGTAGLPFVALGNVDGSYVAAALVGGGIVVSARVPGTSLLGTGTVAVPAPEADGVPRTVLLDVTLAGQVTAASVAPADGSVAVERSAQVEIETPVPLNPATATTDNVQLLKLPAPGDIGDPVSVPLRLVLSGSGRSLSVIPQQILDFSSSYRVQASGLADVVGGLVSVPVTTFRTKDDAAPQYQLDSITFSFPNQDGLVKVTAPAGTLPPGTEVLIINSGNGVVATFTAENDGAVGSLVPAELPASINDQLFITVTDPLGNVVTFTRSQFTNPATGETAVGPGGGTIEGPGGVELRIPEGALDKGVVFKIEGVTAEQLKTLFPNQKPDFSDASGNPQGLLASGLKIESADKPTLKKEAKLAFPLTQNVIDAAAAQGLQPKDAFFHVFRRLDKGDGKAAFEVIDIAFIEGEGANAKVVTASYPHGGYFDSVGTVGGTAVVTNYMFLMATISSLLPAAPLPGAITGLVRRTKFAANNAETGAGGAEFEGIAGALVSGVDQAGVPLIAKSDDNAMVARTNKDGRFTLWDLRYTGGVVKVAATLPDAPLPSGTVGDVCAAPPAGTLCGTAFEAAPGDWSTTSLRFFRSKATVNLTFPPVRPAPAPPQLEIVVLRQSDGARISGVTVAGTPLWVGFKNNTPGTEFTIPGAEIQGQAVGVEWPLSVDVFGFFYRINGGFTADTPGTYTISATALPAFGSPVTASATFRVIAAGGGLDTDETSPPRVMTDRTLPKLNAAGVPVGAFVQLAFTEPVKRLPGNVKLIEAGGGEVQAKLSGVTPSGALIDDVTSEDAVVTSLTIQPRLGLKYNASYRVEVLSGIEDLDATPKPLVPYETTFQTFGPTFVGGSEDQTGSPGLVVLGERAYIAKTNNFVNGNVLAFDVTDPGEPKLVSTSETFAPRPYDIAGDVVGGQATLAVATGSTNRSKPASVLFFDANPETEETVWVGAASVTNSALEGFVSRLTMKGGFAYTATVRKGIQVVQLTRNLLGLDALARQNARAAINTDGSGFGQEYVVQTIPIPAKDGGSGFYYLSDIKAAEIQGRTLVAVVGEPGLVLADPTAGSLVFPASGFPGVVKTPDDSFTLGWGQVLALGRLADRDIAVVVTRTHIATVDLSTPENPSVLGYLDLSADIGTLAPVDVVLKDQTALVSVQNAAGDQGFVLLIALDADGRLTRTGRIEEASGRLALSGGLLLSSARMATGGTSARGGVKTTALSDVAIITKVQPPLIPVSAGDEVFSDVKLSYKLVPPVAQTGEVTIDVAGGSRVTTLPAPIDASGNGTTTWPQGTIVNLSNTYEARLKAQIDGRDVPSFAKRLPFDRVPLAITTKDRLLRIQFALAEQGLFSERNYSVRVFLAAQGQPFPASPSFSIWSQEIREAPENVDVSWDRAEANDAEHWVTRRIATMAMPPGTDTSIKRRAFEIGTVLRGYPQVKVQVVGEDSGGRVLSEKIGTITADGDWSLILETVRDRVRASAGDFGVPAQPMLPAPGSFDASRLWDRFEGYVFRVADAIDNLAIVYQGALLKGLVDGFFAGLEGDKAAVSMLATAFTQNPKTTARSVWEFFVKLKQAFPSFGELWTKVKGIRFDVSGILPSSADEALLLSAQGLYFAGVLVGFIIEQALVITLLTAVGGAIGGAIAAALLAIKVPGWIVTVVRAVATSIRVLWDFFVKYSGLGLAREWGVRALTFVRQHAGEFVELLRRTPGAKRVVEAIAELAYQSAEVAGRALYWLNRVEAMSENAGVRFVFFFQSKPTTAEQWVTRWTLLNANGHALRIVFESVTRAGEISEGAHHALVATALVDEAAPARLAAKYGDQLDATLSPLKTSLDDARYADEAIGRSGKVHANSLQSALSAEGVEGSVKFVRDAGPDLAQNEAALAKLAELEASETDDIMKFIRDPESTPDVSAGMRKMVEGCVTCGCAR
jgi:hypothetical protein